MSKHTEALAALSDSVVVQNMQARLRSMADSLQRTANQLERQLDLNDKQNAQFIKLSRIARDRLWLGGAFGLLGGTALGLSIALSVGF